MSLRYAALGLLAQRPGSGYDLLKRFEQSMGNVWSATQSQLYTELNSLSAEELIAVTSVGPRGRKEYAITDAGRDALRTWLAEPSHEPIRNRRLLRVFMLGEVPPDTARTHFEQTVAMAEEALVTLERLRADIKWSDNDSDRFGRRNGASGPRRWSAIGHSGHWARSQAIQPSDPSWSQGVR